MQTAVLYAVGGGVVSAMLTLTLLLGHPASVFLAYLTQFPLAFVGLGHGAAFLAIAGAVGTLLLILGEGGVFAVLFVLLNVAPLWWLIRLALQSYRMPDGSIAWYPPGLLVTWMTGFAVAGLTLAYLYFAGAEEGFPGAVERFLVLAFEPMAEAMTGTSPERVAASLAPVFPAIVLVSWMLMVAVNTSLAQGVLVRFARNLRPTPKVSEIELPRWAVAPLAVALLLAVVGDGWVGHYGNNLTLVLCLPFFFAGLAVVHAFARRQTLRWGILIGVYLMLFLFGWPAVALVVLGFVEQWAGLRRRLAAGGPD